MEYTMEISTAKENMDNLKVVEKFWYLGPLKTSIRYTANKDYWSKLATLWQCTEAEARRRLCSNCEYYNNTAEMQKLMEKIPLNKFDIDGGGRGYCHRFDFICHNLRTCQAQENKNFELGD